VLYRVAIMNCIWFKSPDCGYTWVVLKTARLFQLHRRSLLWSHCCWTELIHKAATYTFNNAHIARAINARCRLMKAKRKKRKMPSSAQSAYRTKWKLNRLAPELLFFFILAHSVYKTWIKQEPNTLELWNKLHFEEKETENIYHFKIFSTYICWINI